MRLICPSCDAQYEVADNVIPEMGRDVQCSNCGTTWFQEPVVAGAGRPVPTVDQRSPHHERPDWEPEPQPAAKRVSADAASILREEAMRELKARLAEKPRVETQPDFGHMPPPEVPPAPAAKAPAPAAPGPEAPAPAPAAGRNRLPDIEEVDTSHVGAPGVAAAAAPGAAQSTGGSFGAGFGLALAAGVAALMLYVYAPQIGTRLPAAEPALSAYVAGADNLRVKLDEIVGRKAGG